jgi:hypothetical protein
MNPLLLTDGYKVDHRRQYPEGTSLVYSNWTPRKSRIEGVNEVVFFGLQYFIKKYIIEDFEQHFFSQPKDKILKEYSRRINNYLKYYDGYGAIIVQMNVEDTRNGVAEYVIEKYGDKVMIEMTPYDLSKGRITYRFK